MVILSNVFLHLHPVKVPNSGVRVGYTWCEEIGTRIMPSRGSACRAEANQTLRTVCANCGRSIPAEVGHAHALDEDIRREPWGLVGCHAKQETVFPTCAGCHDAGWRPPDFVSVN